MESELEKSVEEQGSYIHKKNFLSGLLSSLDTFSTVACESDLGDKMVGLEYDELNPNYLFGGIATGTLINATTFFVPAAILYAYQKYKSGKVKGSAYSYKGKAKRLARQIGKRIRGD